MLWERDDDDAYHAAVKTATGEIRFRLVVKRSNGSRDWSVWNPRLPAILARHSVADTVQDAIKAAEQAAQ
jgi:hypothetical protein